MRAEKDYEDLLRLFNKHKVKYCIKGLISGRFGKIEKEARTEDRKPYL